MLSGCFTCTNGELHSICPRCCQCCLCPIKGKGNRFAASRCGTVRSSILRRIHIYMPHKRRRVRMSSASTFREQFKRFGCLCEKLLRKDE
ncbi:uncharacterized protein [Coffea arabica]|uniref:Uncharacterized protein isoform X3 n=1 Tax=Coffea arabica TaxID=13443 RepID=A0ABM4URU3_COFAR